MSNPENTPTVGGPTNPDFNATLLIQAVQDRDLEPGPNGSIVDPKQQSALPVWPVQVKRAVRCEWGVSAQAPGGDQGSCKITPETLADFKRCEIEGDVVKLGGVPQKLVTALSNGHRWAQLEADIADEPTPPAVSMR